MRIEIKLLYNYPVRTLVVDKDDPHTTCENCLGPKYDHPDLAGQDDTDWCLNCNDAERIRNWGPIQYSAWVREQMVAGKIMCIGREIESHKYEGDGRLSS